MKFVSLMILVFLANVCYAVADEPVLQIKEYEVVPANIYPSTTGQLKLTLENSGSEVATGTTVYYTYNSDEKWSGYVGDIGSNSEAITTIPFVVPEQVSSGIMVITLDVYYMDEDSTSTKHSMSSIPITITQHQILEVDTISLSQETIRRGEQLEVGLEIKNTGGVMKNVIIAPEENSSFRLDGTTTKRVGDIEKNSSTKVSVTLVSSSSAEEGKYSIPLVVTYNDALQNEISQTIYVGPVMVTDSSSLFRLSCEALSETEIGSQLEYEISITNQGNSVQSAKLIIEENDVFTPIGPNILYFDDILPGQTRSETVVLGIDSDSASGYYTLPMTLQTNGDEISYSSGIFVQATPAIVLTTETESTGGQTQVTIRIANSGNTAVRSLYIAANPTENLRISGANEKFIGTLNVDDFATFQVNVAGGGNDARLPLTIIFKDNDNVEHTMSYSVSLGSMQEMPIGSEAGPAPGYPRPGTGPNLLVYVGGGALLLVLAFLGYTRLKGKKNEN
jgi:hypothetical protein